MKMQLVECIIKCPVKMFPNSHFPPAADPAGPRDLLPDGDPGADRAMHLDAVRVQSEGVDGWHQRSLPMLGAGRLLVHLPATNESVPERVDWDGRARVLRGGGQQVLSPAIQQQCVPRLSMPN